MIRANPAREALSCVVPVAAVHLVLPDRRTAVVLRSELRYPRLTLCFASATVGCGKRSDLLGAEKRVD